LGDSGSSPEWQPARVEPEEWQGRSPEWQRQQGLVLGRFGSRPAPGWQPGVARRSLEWQRDI